LIFNTLQKLSDLSAFKRFARFLADVGKMWGKCGEKILVIFWTSITFVLSYLHTIPTTIKKT
jgi:hypothetical protein